MEPFREAAGWIVIGKTALLLLLLFPQEKEPRVEVQLHRSEIYEGESVQYSVLVHNTRSPSAPDLSSFSDYGIQPAGEQSLNSSRLTIINGRVSREETFGRTYRYLLTPKKTGTLTVPSPRVEVEGRICFKDFESKSILTHTEKQPV